MNEPYHLLTKIRFAALLTLQPKIWIKFSKMDLEITFNCCCVDPRAVYLLILHLHLILHLAFHATTIITCCRM